MIFDRMPVADAEGAILAHSVRTPSGMFKKGRQLSAEDIAILIKSDLDTVVAARLEAGDVPEDEAATRIARAAQGPGTAFAAAFTGRCNLFAEARGLAVVDPDLLDALNMLDEAITIATLPAYEPVEAKQMVATVKIIPFAASASAVAEAERLASDRGPLVRVATFARKNVGLVMTHLPGTKPSVLDNTVKTVGARLDGIDATLADETRVDHDETAIAKVFLESDLKRTADGWYETPPYRVKRLKRDMYFRVRGSNLPPKTEYETDAKGSPLADSLVEQNLDLDTTTAAWHDLWFYSNPVFVRVE